MLAEASMLVVCSLYWDHRVHLFKGFPLGHACMAKIWARCVPTHTLYYLTTGSLFCHFQKLLWNRYFSTPTTVKILSGWLADESPKRGGNQGQWPLPGLAEWNSLPSLDSKRMLLLLVLGFGGSQQEIGALNSSNVDLSINSTCMIKPVQSNIALEICVNFRKGPSTTIWCLSYP